MFLGCLGLLVFFFFVGCEFGKYGWVSGFVLLVFDGLMLFVF